jgi:NAD(P)-dependent dehydrogenase (short-subunit alcohol dehydrogenase family)
MSELEGKVCLVTGGAGHIGRAICEALLSQGAEVIAVGRREPATPIAHGGRAAAFVSADIRDAAASQGGH